MSRIRFRIGTALAAAWLSAGSASAAPEQDAAAARRLGQAIRFRTVSHQDPARLERETFLAFHAFLERSFPRAHRRLEREVVNELSLLYRWPGSDPSLDPILVAAHFDVVPVVAAQRDEWEHPPFAGVVADGFVWGRGAQDDKVGVMAALEAAERLAADGFRPKRSVLLAFGHDEEVGGAEGAGAIAARLREQGVRLAFTLDEGLAVVEDVVPGVDVPVALLGIAEKGYLTLRITTHHAGGHSSVPPPHTSVGRLAQVIGALETNPLPARVEGPAAAMFDAIAPHTSLPMRLLLTQRWLTAPLLVWRLGDNPASNALLRTTTAVTMVEGGVKENVLPPSATATVNFRLLPGDTAESVIEHVRRVIDDPSVEIETTQTREASPVSDPASGSYALLRRCVELVLGEVVVSPGLVLGGTDTKHYVELAEQSYRFTPMRAHPEDLPRVHGVNERLGVANYDEVIRFYETLLREAAGAEGWEEAPET